MEGDIIAANIGSGIGGGGDGGNTNADTIQVVQYQQPNASALVVSGRMALDEAKETLVDSLAMRQIATDGMNLNKARIKQLDEAEKYLTKPLLEHVERIRSIYREPKKLHDDASTCYAAKIIDYNREQERLRRVEQDRLAALARAEQDRVRAEAARVAAKAEQDARALREQAEAARAAGNAGKAAQLEVRADAKVEAGENRAAVLNDMANAATIAPILPAAPKMAGAHETVRWTIEEGLIDMGKLVEFVAANPMYLNLLKADTTALTALARSLKENFNIPGVIAKRSTGLTKSRAA